MSTQTTRLHTAAETPPLCDTCHRAVDLEHDIVFALERGGYRCLDCWIGERATAECAATAAAEQPTILAPGTWDCELVDTGYRAGERAVLRSRGGREEIVTVLRAGSAPAGHMVWDGPGWGQRSVWQPQLWVETAAGECLALLSQLRRPDSAEETDCGIDADERPVSRLRDLAELL